MGQMQEQEAGDQDKRKWSHLAERCKSRKAKEAQTASAMSCAFNTMHGCNGSTAVDGIFQALAMVSGSNQTMTGQCVGPAYRSQGTFPSHIVLWKEMQSCGFKICKNQLKSKEA